MESTWIPLFLHFASISIFPGFDILPLSPLLALTVMGVTEKAPRCCLASLFPLFTAKALTVLLLTSMGGKMDTLTFHTPKMWQRVVLLVNTVHYCLDSWWPIFNLPAPASAKTAHKPDFLTCRRDQSFEASLFFYFIILCSSVFLSLFSTM